MANGATAANSGIPGGAGMNPQVLAALIQLGSTAIQKNAMDNQHASPNLGSLIQPGGGAVQQPGTGTESIMKLLQARQAMAQPAMAAPRVGGF